jgi:hypothetical protein
VSGRDPFRIACAKHLFFNTICPLCANVSETEAKADVEEADRTDATDADPEEIVALTFASRPRTNHLLASAS